MKKFLNDNKVFIVGLLQFVLTSLSELFNDGSGKYSTYIIVYSAVIAILTYFGKNIRGQWASIATTVLSAVTVYGSLHDNHTTITISVLVTSILIPLTVNIIGIFYTSPTKDAAYEKSNTIQTAKAEAKAITTNKV